MKGNFLKTLLLTLAFSGVLASVSSTAYAKDVNSNTVSTNITDSISKLGVDQNKKLTPQQRDTVKNTGLSKKYNVTIESIAPLDKKASTNSKTLELEKLDGLEKVFNQPKVRYTDLNKSTKVNKNLLYD